MFYLQLGTYLFDFGNIVRGSARRKSIRLSNTGILPVHIDIDKKQLHGKVGLLLKYC